ncbi:MAG: 5'-nucleotidase C-terminal domain-containing protein, partial [Candidatus Izemoplasma sp.]
GYEFANPIPIIEQYATELRTEHDVDFVFVVSHDPGSSLNSSIAAFTGDAKIDAIFNGHSHYVYAQDNLGIPVLQSGGTGSYVGHVRFLINDGEITSFAVENIGMNDDPLLLTSSQRVQDIIAVYQSETDAIFNNPIIDNEVDLWRGDLTLWISKLMRINTGADIAFHNSGGTRTNIVAGQTINMGLLYEVWPFDNYIMTVELTGAQIKSFMGSGDGSYYDTDIAYFDDDTYYLVATNDFVFDRNYVFEQGLNENNTYLYFRDIAAAELELQNDVFDTFSVNNEIQSGNLTD